MSFKDLCLSPEIIRAIDEMGFENATEIQKKAIPEIKKRIDIIGRSQTGTGKTLAFGIPAVEFIDTSIKKGVQVLVLCPTRELAVQACEEIKKVSKFKDGIKATDIYGGTSIDRQILKLKSANIVIGTPGRIMDHIQRKTLKLDNVKMVVLDEADEMLNMGFREDIEEILSKISDERQTVLFSATMPPEILALTKKYQKNPQLIEINKQKITVENIEQFYYNIPVGRKMDALNLILKFALPSRAIIFCNTKKMVEDVSEYLHSHSFSSQGIHGDMKQTQRNKVMESFKKGHIAILVATDVAARGIDVNDIEYVINYDIPQNTEYYIHRIGRTGRAGKSGKAITLCCGRSQISTMHKLAKLVRSKIEEQNMPSLSDIHSKRFERNLNKVKNQIDNENNSNYEKMFENLIADGYSEKSIALAALNLYFVKTEINISEIVAKKDVSKRNFNNHNYKKIVINIGRAKRVAPNHIVGAITETTKMSGRDIGKIEIYNDQTIVDIPENLIASAIDKMKDCKICGNPTITKIYKSQSNFSNNRKTLKRFKHPHI